MLPAAKHLDIVTGVDIHIVMVPTPGGPVPTPIPHPFIGMIFDSGDYDAAQEAMYWAGEVGLDMTPVMDLKNAVTAKAAAVADKYSAEIGLVQDLKAGVESLNVAAQINKKKDELIGKMKDTLGIKGPSGPSSVRINHMHRAKAGTKGKNAPKHIPIGGPAFQKGMPGNACEMFMGSMTVSADGEPLSFMACPVLSCHCIGMPVPKRKKGASSSGSYLPTSVVLPIPLGPPVLVGGPPIPSLSLLMGKLFDKIMDKIKNSAFVKRMSQAIHNSAGRLMTALGIPGDSFMRGLVHSQICDVTGHPVDIATGKVFTEIQDFKVTGPIPLEWNRKWFSTSVYRGPFGHGWHWNYDIALAVDPKENAIVVRMEDGRPAIFPPLLVGGSETNPFENLTLTRDKDGYTMRDKQGLFYRFEKPKKTPEADIFPLESVKNPAGHQIAFSYNSAGHLARITDSAGRIFKVQCNAQGCVTAVEAPHPDRDGEFFTIAAYRYDQQGNLIEALDALQAPFSYEYRNHLLIRETNRNKLNFYFQYDGEDSKARCIRTWGDEGIFDHNLTYNLEEKWTIVENSLGHRSTYHWNDTGVVWKVVNPLGHTRYKQYTPHNKLAAEVDELGQTTSYQYDGAGNRIGTIFPDGASVSLQYEDGLLVAATDQMGGSWKWAYNEQRQLIVKTDPLGRTTTYTQRDGLLEKITDPTGGETILTYDNNKNLVTLTTADGATTRWEHDRLGRVVKTTDPKGNARLRRYNHKGWILEIIEPDGNRRDIQYDPAGNITHAKDLHYDVQFEYVQMNRLKARMEAGTRVEFNYDTEGNLRGIVNEHGFAYRFDLDENMRVAVESGFDGVTRHYIRDAAGRTSKVERPGGIVSNYEYDPRGRVVAVRHSDGSSEKFAYRADGELIEATNDHIAVKFERDGLGRILKEIQGGFVVESKYDLSGLRTEVLSSLGAHLTFGRNDMGDVEQVLFEGEKDSWEASFRRDNVGLEIERLLPGGVRSEWKRDSLGRPTAQKTFSAGGNLSLSRQYEWDVNYRLKKIVDEHSGVTQFEHDQFGNLASARYGDGTVELRMPDAVGNLFRTSDRKDRKYGPAGQLLEADGIRYEYDAEGNLIRKTERNGAIWQYDWNASGMLRRVVRPDGDTVLFTYDALGRRIAKQYRNKTTRWVWDGNKMLHEWVEQAVEEPQEPHGMFPTDTGGLVRIKRRDELVATAPAHAPPAPGISKDAIADRRPSYDDLTTWIFEPGSFAPMGKMKGGQQYSIVTDHLGTPVGMFDAKGQKVWSMNLSIYGEVRKLDGWREACPFRYPGQYEDVETGLYYNRFRYYDPGAGVYLKKDPIGLKGGMELYSYVFDPNTRTDVFGLSEKCWSNEEKEGELYRWDQRSPEEIEAAGGFESWGDDMDLDRHTSGDSIKDKTSGYVSTSKTEAGAMEVAAGRKGYLYTIKDNGNGTDVNKTMGSSSPFPTESEVAVPKKIPSSDIISSQPVN